MTEGKAKPLRNGTQGASQRIGTALAQKMSIKVAVARHNNGARSSLRANFKQAAAKMTGTQPM